MVGDRPEAGVVEMVAGFWVIVLLLVSQSPAWSQTVSGVRGINGGVGNLFNLVGANGNLYADNNGTQGFIYTFGNFETYNFRSAAGPHWSGGQMTLGPQLSVGLIQGVNQGASPIIFPSPPRDLPPLPDVESSQLSPSDIP
jgi:hypothetical protein